MDTNRRKMRINYVSHFLHVCTKTQKCLSLDPQFKIHTPQFTHPYETRKTNPKSVLVPLLSCSPTRVCLRVTLSPGTGACSQYAPAGAAGLVSAVECCPHSVSTDNGFLQYTSSGREDDTNSCRYVLQTPSLTDNLIIFVCSH